VDPQTNQTVPGLEHLSWSSRLVTAVEALLLGLGLLALIFQGVSAEDRSAISAADFFYAAWVAVAHRRGWRTVRAAALMSLETWGMIPFITWVIWFTDKLASPLRSVYILIVITSALTLGMRNAMWQTGLIAVCLVVLGESYAFEDLLSVGYLSGLVAMLTPLIVVGYLTSLFAAEIRFGMRKSELSQLLDELTGLYTMPGVAVVADRLIAHAARGGRPVCLLMIDIDRLSTINTAHGRTVGDLLIKEVAHIVQGGLRNNDALGRYREDKFIAVLPETTMESALEVAERIRAAVASASIMFEDTLLPATVSIGLASDAIDQPRFDAMVCRALQAMRTAKETGRNSVVKFHA